MKKAALVFTTAIFFLCAAAPIFAQNTPNAEPTQARAAWKFSLEGSFGARVGAYNEIVWAKKKSDGERYKQSELNYELAPIFYTGLNFRAAYKRLEIKFLSKFFYSQKSGTLTDSDWQNDAYLGNGDIHTKTDYSAHSLYLNPQFAGIAGYDIEAQTEYKFHPTNFLTLAPLFSFNAQCMNFRARGGTGWYGQYDKKRDHIPPYTDQSSRLVVDFGTEPVLDYQVYNMFFWTGLRAEFEIFSWMRVSLASEISPLSILLDFDQHLTTHRDFKELAFSAFFAFRQSVRTEFKIQENFLICQSFIFLLTGESEGSMYLKRSSESEYTKISANTGGNKMTYIDVELSAKILW